jgi:hypothetical protein
MTRTGAARSAATSRAIGIVEKGHTCAGEVAPSEGDGYVGAVSALDRLVELVAPPSMPRKPDYSIQSRDRWLELPADYQALLETYGSGAFRQSLAEITIHSFANPNPYFDIVAGTREMADLLGEIYPDLRNDWLPYGFWPDDAAGLVQWGSAEIERLFWLIDGGPDEWPVVVMRDTEQVFERLDLTVTEFLLGLIEGPPATQLILPLDASRVRFSKSPGRAGELYDD